MKKGIFRLVSFAFLAVFVFVKIANAHTYSHLFGDENSIENCQVCEYYQVQEDNDLIVPSFTESFEIFNPYFPEPTESFTFVLFVPSSSVSGKYFNRPPPASLLG
ncbi:hypothetical protein GWK08_10160 [Leptobacterium flavescens]|uniref:Uncharacterized protein n=1 Tax=Leptobacterium flavescens TaxID=472055 RepID=A0A6P0UKQ5_9FLAO|nr:hypothetical protein [Leptobacterium flavescens]NER13804.1 hypothetical protein [Leptobacterium flavescens]